MGAGYAQEGAPGNHIDLNTGIVGEAASAGTGGRGTTSLGEERAIYLGA